MCGGGGDYYRDRAKARNAISVIFTVNAGASGGMLFTGDATNESFEKLAAQSFDIVKVAHHGSQVTNTLAMIEKFKARHYLISGKTAGSILQPGLQTLQWIAESATNPEMWLTNWDQENPNNLYCLDRLVDHNQTPYTVSLVRAGVASLRFVTDAGSIAGVRDGDYEVVLPRNDDGLLCPNLPNFSNSLAHVQEQNATVEQAHYTADVHTNSPVHSNSYAGKHLQHSE
ncbi:hypothetical protein K7432_017669 [Basidiobolus ranarum]|uniref:Uncharacterized protein n=1 Tax=Basidiobolus ranarum TaxID=34480 RepID=A0ABR2VK27_9FUNG